MSETTPANPALITPPAASPAAASSSSAPPAATPPASNPPAATPPAQPAATPPADIKLTAPAGVSVDEAKLKGVAEFAKANGMSQEAAQKMLEREVGLETSFNERMKTQATQAREQWVQSVKTDKELGGTNFNTAIASAQKAVQAFASPELRKLLNETGMGDHPEVVRLFAKIGNALREDSLVTDAAAPPAKEKPIEERWYGQAAAASK